MRWDYTYIHIYCENKEDDLLWLGWVLMACHPCNWHYSHHSSYICGVYLHKGTRFSWNIIMIISCDWGFSAQRDQIPTGYHHADLVWLGWVVVVGHPCSGHQSHHSAAYMRGFSTQRVTNMNTILMAYHHAVFLWLGWVVVVGHPCSGHQSHHSDPCMWGFSTQKGH